jgi:hypothetical protein
MPIISFKEYKEKFERILTEVTILNSEFDYSIEDLIFQAPMGAMQLDHTSFLIRTSLLEENETCANVSRCSYVPDSKRNKIPLQRCNLKSQQVFYASIPGGMRNFSDGAQPSLMETVMQKIIDDPTFDSRKAAVSRWQIKHQPVFWFLPHYTDSIDNNENFKFLFNQFDGFLKKNSESIELYQNFTEKLNYLSELFCRNYEKEKTYKVTATYYNKVMSLAKPDNSSYDALIYPSANTKGEGMNIVLTKDYVGKQNIYCDLVVLYAINRSPGNAKDIWFTPLAQAVPDKLGNLDFKPLNKNILD